MYIPRQFAMTPEQARDVLETADTAQLITAHETGPVATLLPVEYEASDEGFGSLNFHLTRINTQWKDHGLGEALAIVSGPDSYIAPEWLASYADAPGVPTWNYVTVHAYGELIVHDDPAWTKATVDRLSRRHGYDTGVVDPEAIERMLRAIVGLEFKIHRVEAKAKLSQNKTPADVQGIIDGLRAEGDPAVADAMEAIALPHATQRYAVIEGIRADRILKS